MCLTCMLSTRANGGMADSPQDCLISFPEGRGCAEPGQPGVKTTGSHQPRGLMSHDWGFAIINPSGFALLRYF
eukprot:1141965-Pelagomonas_calceolata.AAC.1